MTNSDNAIIDGMKVVYDGRTQQYLCAGQGLTFRAWFAGMNENRMVEAEIIDSTGECIGLLYTPAPNNKIPSADEVARSFGPQLATQLANGID